MKYFKTKTPGGRKLESVSKSSARDLTDDMQLADSLMDLHDRGELPPEAAEGWVKVNTDGSSLSFSASGAAARGSAAAYRSGWDAIFKKRKEKPRKR